ncbi:MAG: hypothetical protein ACI8ZM_004524 [Crocinitomix sp.]|jgi:hypothetical protein
MEPDVSQFSRLNDFLPKFCLNIRIDFHQRLSDEA